MSHITAEIALQELLSGNQRYVEGKQAHPRQTMQHCQQLSHSQNPFAIILGCADSRVPPELVFDQGLGDLFVVRVAGNIIDEGEVMGSLEYAVEHLKTPLLVVLGHKNCGAVKATVDALSTNEEVTGHLRHLVNAIKPAVAECNFQSGDVLDSAIRANVQRTVRRLGQMEPVLSAKVRDGKLKIIGAHYDLESGKVDLLSGEND